MSLDVYLYGKPELKECCCPNCGNNHTYTGSDQLFSKNITHNLGTMAEQVGLYEPLWSPEALGFTKGSDLIEPLKKGLEKLKAFPEKYSVFNAQNGWGKYENLVEFVSAYLEACEEYPEAEIEVSR